MSEETRSTNELAHLIQRAREHIHHDAVAHGSVRQTLVELYCRLKQRRLVLQQVIVRANVVLFGASHYVAAAHRWRPRDEQHQARALLGHRHRRLQQTDGHTQSSARTALHSLYVVIDNLSVEVCNK